MTRRARRIRGPIGDPAAAYALRVTSASGDAQTMRGRTRWIARENMATPVRQFLRTESASSGVLVAGIVAGLIWANVDNHSYESVWGETLSITLGHHVLSMDLRTWINSGLMALFFLVVGLEARREIDLGDLRDRRRFVLPVVAGLIGMALPVLIFLAFTAGSSATSGWGVAMSTDTALSLGLLALLGRGVPEQARVFLLTVFVVDDLASLIVIAFAYSDNIEVMPILIAVIAFAALIAALHIGVDRPPVYVVLGVIVWGALQKSGIDPVVAGLAIGLAATAYSPGRENLEAATGMFRRFREQPTAELAREAATGLTAALSPNARLQRFYHPWTSFLIVPLFAIANSGVALSGPFLRDAFTSPITLGVLVGYVVGKPLAIIVTSWLLARFTGGRIRPTIGWGSVAGSGTLAGIGFTVSFLIATLAFDGHDLALAKTGVLSAAVVAAGLTWTVFYLANRMTEPRRARALLGDVDEIVDLAVPVDPDRDHVRGPATASVTVVEYGDFQCPYCGMAEPAVREELSMDADVRFVWRHLPLSDVHDHAQIAAEAAEAAAAQGAFWPMHDLLLTRQNRLREKDLVRYAEELSLDVERFRQDLMKHVHTGRVAGDIESADLSNVSGTPTFFINGSRHYGAYDVASLATAIRTARDRARLGRSGRGSGRRRAVASEIAD